MMVFQIKYQQFCGLKILPGTASTRHNMKWARKVICVSIIDLSLIHFNRKRTVWIHWLRLLKNVSWYDTKQSDGEASIILELWGTRRIPSLPLLPGPLWPGLVAPDWFLSKGQYNYTVMKLNRIFSNELFLHLPVCEPKNMCT